ncbi:unnamed protein product (mitochondrion) [Plasmodiophora brassicae]|uniref:Uncharacterized protein n=1 Tax=Plasmodiophora brassicae TaxID=37360 RepID=A0A3P3Y7I0_PLABS|nr:unnamed protein product [Plasmodiophora brassicae]
MNRRRRAQAATPGPVFEGIERFKDITLEKETVSRWATRCQTVLVFALSYSCRRISRIVPQGVKRPEPQAADAEPPAIPVAPPCPLPCRLPTPAIRKPFIVRRALSSAKQHWASMDRSLKTALSAILLLALLNMVAPGTTRVAAELSVVWIALILHDRLSRLIDGNVPVLRQDVTPHSATRVADLQYDKARRGWTPYLKSCEPGYLTLLNSNRRPSITLRLPNECRVR